MKPKRAKRKAGPAGIDAYRKRLGALYRAALRDGQPAVKTLLEVAGYATFLVEHLYRQKPYAVKEWARREHKFPVLMSWNHGYNAWRYEMIRQLKLGGMLPLKTDGARDAFYVRLVEVLIPSIGLDVMEERVKLPPLTADTKSCRKWAGAIADTSYTKNRPLELPNGVHPVDWKFSKGFAEHYRRLRLKRHKVRSDYPGSEIGEMGQQTRADASQKMTWGDFRSGFIDTVASRLKHGVRESPWHFHGGIEKWQRASKQRGTKTLKSI